MQCPRAARHTLCSARNAYNPLLALRATFATDSKPADAQPIAPTSNADHEHPPPRVRTTSIGLRTASNEAYGDRPYEKLPSRRTRTGQPSLADFDLRRPPNKINGWRTRDASSWKVLIMKVRETIRFYNGRKKTNPDAEMWNSEKTLMDYYGNVILPVRTNNPPSPLPWAVREPGIGRIFNSLELLSKEIRSFANYMEPTRAERIARQQVIKDIKELLDPLGEQEGVGYEVFGSEITGLAMPFSDIDIRVFNQGGEENVDRVRLRTRMNLILKKLYKSDKWMAANLRHATYPIINVQHRSSGIDVQIVSNTSATNQHKAVEHLLATIPNLRDLFMVVRTFFDMRGFADVFNGGLGSYGIFILLAAPLVRQHPTPAFNRTSGGQLRRFLIFYKHLSLRNRGVRVSKHPRFPKHRDNPQISNHIDACLRRGDTVRAGQWLLSQTVPTQDYLLCLQDPADPKNDLGKKTNAIKHISMSLSAFQDILRDMSRVVDQAAENRQPRPQASLLLPLVGECHEYYAERRKKIQDFGEVVMGEMERERIFGNKSLEEQWGEQKSSQEEGMAQFRKLSMPARD